MANPPKETRGRAAAIRAAGIVAFEAPRRAAPPPQRAAVIVEARDHGEVADQLREAKIDQLSDSFLSVEGDVASIVQLTQLRQVRRVQTKKVAQMHLDAALPEIGLVAPQAGRARSSRTAPVCLSALSIPDSTSRIRCSAMPTASCGLRRYSIRRRGTARCCRGRGDACVSAGCVKVGAHESGQGLRDFDVAGAEADR
jgi:hypothetical protein